MDNPLFSTAFKDDYNYNIELLRKSYEDLQNLIDAANVRTSNNVIAAGGDNITEVVDARASSLAPSQAFKTLHDRITYAEQALSDGVGQVSTQITDLNNRYLEMEDLINRIYGLNQGTIEYFVDSGKGDDVNGTGAIDSPFKTVTKAVSMLPRLLSTTVYIWLNPGKYDEDIVVTNINGAKINILSTNYATVDPSKGPTGIQVRSLYLEDIVGSVYISGLEETNTAGTTKNYFIRASRCGFVRVQKCRMAYSTKAIDPFTAVFIDACKADVNSCYFASQNVDIRGYNAADVIAQGTTHGANSAIGLYPQSSVIYNANNVTWKADTPNRPSGGGEVRA
ncbi:hypothetical protein HB912_07030 [Listeria aquatica]|uniref:Uncharacterized protein n=2 Tax=Listeria aquatica TaxID=1494960 RepID=A0A841ZPE6_9LIST|nr:hypothetical protein [Listeria aquatica]